MKKSTKIILGSLLMTFVIVCVVVALPLVIDPNDYKSQIIESVKRQTGRDLVIEGDIGLSVFPKIGLNLGSTSLSNAAGFDGQVFASAEAVSIKVALIPLLSEKVEMDEIVLQGVSLNLQRDQLGKTNWSDLVGKSPEVTAAGQSVEADGVAKLQSLAIGGVRIEDAKILWRDDQQGQQYEINGFNLVSGMLSAGKPADIEMNTAFSSKAYNVDGQLQLKAIVQMDLSGSRLSLSNLDFSLHAKGDALPEEVKLSFLADQLSFSLQERTMALMGFNMTALGVGVKGDVSGEFIMSDTPQFTAKLVVDEFNVREVVKMLGQAELDMADANALTRLSASFDLTATRNSVKLQNLAMALDESQLMGAFSITDFSSQKMIFDLNIDHIDLDRYLPLAGGQQGRKAIANTVASTDSSQVALFPVETLRKLNATGTARIKRLKSMDLEMTDIVVKVRAHEGEVNVKPSALLYQGKFDGDVNIDARQQVPSLKLNSNLEGVQLEPLLKGLQSEVMSVGMVSAKLDISAVGNSQSAVKKTLNGHADFFLENGALAGIDIVKVIRDGIAKVKGEPVRRMNQPEKTDFTSLGGTVKITNGVMDNQDFNMQSSLLHVIGSGKVDLVQENLNYLLKVSVVGSLQELGGKDLEKLEGLTVPMRVHGPFSSLSYKPDLSTVLSDTVKGKVRQKLEDKLKGKLKGLF